ncbi:MAG TPA: Gfo/Idh/MocA family oxidoreductase, partial [Roseiflexaceae bacterium]|nr:Gfo/Idh/MocA family oxidoreductase [Roseiflexaceae bacterium]
TERATEVLSEDELVAIADANQEEATRVAKRHGIPQIYSDFRELLAHPEIVAVDVCLHNNFHAPVTIAALEAGKHVFCEKPMAGTYIDALTMYEAAQRTGRRLGIQLATLFSNETKAAQRLIDAGALGRLYYARAVAYRRRGRPYVDGYGTSNFVRKATASGGALIDLGVYYISQALYLLGNPAVETISGKSPQEVAMYEDRRTSGGYDVEELALGFARLAGNVTLDIEVSWAQHYAAGESSKVLGSQGGVRLDPLAFFTSIADMDLDGTFNLNSAAIRLHATDPSYAAYDGPQQHWIATLQGVVPGIDTAGLALATALISEGIYLSTKLGREVTPEEIREHSVSTSVAL